MRGVVEIGSGNAVECSRRLLAAIQSGCFQLVRRELARAGRVCERAATNPSFAGEQADLLGAVVERMRLSPWGDAELFLLGHLVKSHVGRASACAGLQSRSRGTQEPVVGGLIARRR